MAVLVDSLEPRDAWTPPETKPLDQAVWQTWVAKNRAQDQRNNAAFLKAVKCIAIAGLLVAAGFWSHLGPFDLPIRFTVAAGAMVAMFHAFHTRRFIFAALFAAVVVFFNPVAPVLSFSGGWQRAVVVASALPFFGSLRLRQFDERTQ
ncbi:MAG TPA: DUF6804 family protein [Bryobacteraceae bacterium]|nr:DUF6804 family protein [Bryobacteraceae bacterium]